MALEREHLVELATAISDGDPVDWDTIESSARTDQDRALIRELRILSGLAAIHRHHSDAVLSPGEVTAERFRCDHADGSSHPRQMG